MDEEGTAPAAAENEEFRFQTVGEQLQAARAERKLTLNEVAAQTRIPIRHLEALERSDFAALPGNTYSVGFAKSYARFMGMDISAIARDLRQELAQSGHAGFVPATPAYEPADPSRVPPRWLAWVAGAAALLVVIGYLAWRSFAFPADPGPDVAAESSGTPVKAATPSAPAPATSGPVVITAIEGVWIKIYDASNKRLFEAEMKPGDSFTVPAGADNPMIVTGRPQSLKVTVGGQEVPPLGPPQKTISDVGVSAAALLARKPSSAANSAPQPR